MTIIGNNSFVASATQAEIESIAEGYDNYSDFDGVISRYAGKLISPYVKGFRTLECGAASGLMTEILIQSARELEVVEAAKHYADGLQNRLGTSVKIHNVLLENFCPDKKFEVIVIAGLLHHLQYPQQILKNARQWLTSDGSLFLTVPNMLSFHRRLHVAMGISESPYVTSTRNQRFCQPGRFDPTSLKDLMQSSGWEVTNLDGFFFKPFPHKTMAALNLSDSKLDGLFEMGRQYPELACQIFASAKLKKNA